jgi:hypothetical protein
MAPNHKPTTLRDAQPKKQRSVLMLQEKLAVLGLLRDSMQVSNMAHKYGRNIIYIHITGHIIKQVLYVQFIVFSRAILTIHNFWFTHHL